MRYVYIVSISVISRIVPIKIISISLWI